MVAVAWAGLLKSPQSETSPNQFSIGNLTPRKNLCELEVNLKWTWYFPMFPYFSHFSIWVSIVPFFHPGRAGHGLYTDFPQAHVATAGVSFVLLARAKGLRSRRTSRAAQATVGFWWIYQLDDSGRPSIWWFYSTKLAMLGLRSLL